MSISQATRTYLDHAATSPVRPEVAEQVAADLRAGLGGWANPAAQHASGRRVGAMLAEARARLAAVVDADPHEVLFTGGGTEADALVVCGRVLAARAAGVRTPRLVTSPLEHPAVLDSSRTAAVRLGAEHVEVAVDAAGRVKVESLRRAAPGAALVSVMAANNETGIMQDVGGLVEAVREATGTRRPQGEGYVPVHSDAVAALGKVPVSLAGWGLDAMTVAGHKIGAPVGVGALVAGRDLALVPATGGGRQERGVRSGTQRRCGPACWRGHEICRAPMRPCPPTRRTCRARPTCGSRTPTSRRCSWASTWRASTSRPGRPATPGWRGPATSCWRWATRRVRRARRCGAPWGEAPPPTTSIDCSRPCPGPSRRRGGRPERAEQG